MCDPCPGLQLPTIKDEVLAELEPLSCLDGFSLLLGPAGDIVHVSENVSRFLGLGQADLLGLELAEFVHPCDHGELGRLLAGQPGPVTVFLRVKCTVTERGRVVNLRQAGYRPLKVSRAAITVIKFQWGSRLVPHLYLTTVHCRCPGRCGRWPGRRAWPGRSSSGWRGPCWAERSNWMTRPESSSPNTPQT